MYVLQIHSDCTRGLRIVNGSILTRVVLYYFLAPFRAVRAMQTSPTNREQASDYASHDPLPAPSAHAPLTLQDGAAEPSPAVDIFCIFFSLRGVDRNLVGDGYRVAASKTQLEGQNKEAAAATAAMAAAAGC